MLTDLSPLVLDHVLSYLPLHEKFRCLSVCKWVQQNVKYHLTQVKRLRTFSGREKYDACMGLPDWQAADYFIPAADPAVLSSILTYCTGVQQLAVNQLVQSDDEETTIIVQPLSSLMANMKFLIWNEDAFPLTINPDWHLTHLSCHNVSASDLGRLMSQGLRSLNIDETDFQDWNKLPAGSST